MCLRSSSARSWRRCGCCRSRQVAPAKQQTNKYTTTQRTAHHTTWCRSGFCAASHSPHRCSFAYRPRNMDGCIIVISNAAGIFAGPFLPRMPVLTAVAVRKGLEGLDTGARESLGGKGLQVQCPFQPIGKRASRHAHYDPSLRVVACRCAYSPRRMCRASMPHSLPHKSATADLGGEAAAQLSIHALIRVGRLPRPRLQRSVQLMRILLRM